MNLDYAIELAARRHAGQKDKGGRPYILHVLRVMFEMKTDEERIVAALHDVVEDTPLSLQDLASLGFSQQIVAAVDALTRLKGQTYAAYIDRVSKNALATRVKLADLIDNMNLARIAKPTAHDCERHERYVWAWYRLMLLRLDATERDSARSDVEPRDVKLQEPL